jgi:hypothetical protein
MLQNNFMFISDFKIPLKQSHSTSYGIWDNLLIILQTNYIRVDIHSYPVCWECPLLDSFVPLPLTVLLEHIIVLLSGVDMFKLKNIHNSQDRLCGLVARVPGCRPSGPGFDPRRYHIFWVVVCLERGPVSLVSINEELLERESSGCGLGNWDWRPWGIRLADHATPLCPQKLAR